MVSRLAWQTAPGLSTRPACRAQTTLTGTSQSPSLPEHRWSAYRAPTACQLALFRGWCWGADPIPERLLSGREHRERKQKGPDCFPHPAKFHLTDKETEAPHSEATCHHALCQPVR